MMDWCYCMRGVYILAGFAAEQNRAGDCLVHVGIAESHWRWDDGAYQDVRRNDQTSDGRYIAYAHILDCLVQVALVLVGVYASGVCKHEVADHAFVPWEGCSVQHNADLCW